VDAAYGLAFKTKRSYQPTFMYRALSGGEADVISAFSSDGRIAADKLIILADPKSAIPPYDAIVLISPKRAIDRRLIEALQPLIGKISVEAMRAANYSVDRDGRKSDAAEAARALEAASGCADPAKTALAVAAC
jgi:osmoprotectant transport system permease protein